MNEIRFCLRSLRKTLGITAAALACIALGVGANSAIFTVVNAVLLSPLPYDNPDQLYLMWGTQQGDQGTNPLFDADFGDLKEQNRFSQSMSAFLANTRGVLTGSDLPESVGLRYVTTDYFSMLGVKAARGRSFVQGDDDSAIPVAILSDRLWKRRFASDEQILNSQLVVDGVSYQVIGVMPESFRDVAENSSLQSDLWIPFPLDPKLSRGMHRLMAMVRLKDDVQPNRAQGDLDIIASRLREKYPDTNNEKGWRLESLHSAVVGNARSTLLVFLAAVALVLVIACANVANLLLSRSNSRRREIALRSALGASRGRLLRLQLTESVLLALVGGAIGLLLGIGAVNFLLRTGARSLPSTQDITLDWKVFAFTFLISAVSGLLFGLWPAVAGSKTDVWTCLKEGSRRSVGSGLGHRSVRGALVTVEVAMALIVVLSASLLVKSFLHLKSVDPGFEAKNVLTMQLFLSEETYPEPNIVNDFYQRLRERIASVPAVESAALAELPPFSPFLSCFGFEIKGAPPFPAGEEPCSEFRKVSPTYFSSMKIPSRSGRLFRKNDPIVRPAVVNRLFAKTMFQEKDPLGRRVSFGGPPFTIVGIVEDVRSAALSYPPQLTVYIPFGESYPRRLNLIVRSRADLSPLLPTLRGLLRQLDRKLAFEAVFPLEALVDRSVASPRFRTFLMSLFALTAFLLALVGIYGTLYHLVSQSRSEIGLRLALGAGRSRLRKTVIWKGMRPVALGLSLGVLMAFGLTQLLSGFLYEVSALDPLLFVAIPLVLAVVALLACWLPARRATSVDPLQALRTE